MTAWTVYIWCVEDASEFRSYFLADLREMVRATRTNDDLDYHIRYSSTRDTFGCYDIIVTSGIVHMELCDEPESNTEPSFRRWLDGRGETTNHTAIVFSSHSSGWDVGSHEFIPYLPTWQIRRVFQELEFRPDIVAFDGCYMSTLENALEMEGLARYMVACETTSPNLGMTGVPAAFRGEPRECALALANHYIDRNDEAHRRACISAYPTDVAVVDLARVLDVARALDAAAPGALVIPDDPAFPFRDLPGARAAVLLHRWTEQKIEAADQPDRSAMTGMSWCHEPAQYTDRGADYTNLRIAQFTRRGAQSGRSPRAAPGSPPRAGGPPCS